MGLAACASTTEGLAGLPNYWVGVTGRDRLASSFASRLDQPRSLKVLQPAPACTDGNGGCATKEEFRQLRSFAKAIDDKLEEPLKHAETARRTFERRACDYLYASLQDQSQRLADAYGPDGPLLPGGSYLYELRHWADSVRSLGRACHQGGGACARLVGYLQEHPEDNVLPEGRHGKAQSRVWNELRLACEIAKTRAPVPNDNPVWCDDSTGLCEQKSCRQWWRQAHGGRPKPKPWVDDREEYDDLRDACAWVSSDRPSSQELNEYQHRLTEETVRRRRQFCSPQWVEGYGGPGGAAQRRHAECILKTGQRCRNGLVLPASEQDETSDWKEVFQEKPVEAAAIAPPSALVQAVCSRGLSRLALARRTAAAWSAFL